MKTFIFSLLLVLSNNCFSATIWSWQFNAPLITTNGTQDGERLEIYITVANDINSTESLSNFQFNFFDGSFGYYGILISGQSERLYTATQLDSNITINPGETYSFHAFDLTGTGIANGTEIYTVNPTLYAGTTDSYLDPFVFQKAATPLTIKITEVPLPPALLFFTSGLFLTLMKKIKY